ARDRGTQGGQGRASVRLRLRPLPQAGPGRGRSPGGAPCDGPRPGARRLPAGRDEAWIRSVRADADTFPRGPSRARRIATPSHHHSNPSFPSVKTPRSIGVGWTGAAVLFLVWLLLSVWLVRTRPPD